jgi:hypothetical protein
MADMGGPHEGAPMASFPGEDAPAPQEEIKTPKQYRARVGEVRDGAFAASNRFRKKGTFYAFLAIALAAISSVIGFVTAAVKEPALGIAAGVVAALATAVTAWQKRQKYDGLAEADRKLYVLLDGETSEYDTKTGSYKPDESAEDKAADRQRRFDFFVMRCEQFCRDANRSLDDPAKP